MTAEVALVATADEIATLPPADRAVMVTHALQESKQWLAVATKGTDPTPIADFKAWAATVAEMTRQKGLASEIQADALEMVRRAERGIGQAVRNGQEAGEIAQRGDSTARGTAYTRHSYGRTQTIEPQVRETTPKLSPKEFFAHSEEAVDAYVMADATDEEFEEALASSRAEGKPTRAGIVRKIKSSGTSPRTRAHLADEIAELAEKGNASAQIARIVGVGEEWVRETARDYSIEIPADKAVGRTRRVDSSRVVREAVSTLEGLLITLPLVDVGDLDPREASEWTASLDQSIRALNRFNKKIKEAVL